MCIVENLQKDLKTHVHTGEPIRATISSDDDDIANITFEHGLPLGLPSFGITDFDFPVPGGRTSRTNSPKPPISAVYKTL